MKKIILICIFLLNIILLSSCFGTELSLEESLAAPVKDDRQDIFQLLGQPDAFDISIIQVEGGQVRLESWRYYEFAVRIDFVNGEAVWIVDIETVPSDTILPAWYDPLDFESGMSISDLTRVISTSSPAGAEPEVIALEGAGEELSEGLLLVGDQILLGFENEQLVYVETIALMSEGGAQ
jgi:hypothetical protein